MCLDLSVAHVSELVNVSEILLRKKTQSGSVWTQMTGASSRLIIPKVSHWCSVSKYTSQLFSLKTILASYSSVLCATRTCLMNNRLCKMVIATFSPLCNGKRQLTARCLSNFNGKNSATPQLLRENHWIGRRGLSARRASTPRVSATTTPLRLRVVSRRPPGRVFTFSAAVVPRAQSV